ncbi:cbb3-type cytochrome oxidase assembly protein CcoS [Wenzhouxiangella sediminis]|uniref:Cbb3-type cytochrome oxidase assembly protein CcoS n=1 Tax=Wenzhouxiangella sediminis TaxID=1792836 RepID=A0A3E1K927_9GAMM|nr:cbb3-type cytochrome oxidase assembly protein CcoS [Wenzhouxiangella sediminis]RFF30225.1 cbb3-type cytochrome oxidase assembly protein CcoS [Wenzhouxiangella sediminis]
MNIIYVLIPLSVLLMLLAIGAFFWAIRNDQFDDLDTPALDILDEDEKPSDRRVNQGAAQDENTEHQDLENAKTQRKKGLNPESGIENQED